MRHLMDSNSARPQNTASLLIISVEDIRRNMLRHLLANKQVDAITLDF